MPTAPPITRLVLYVRDIPKVAAFYMDNFGFLRLPGNEQDVVRLESPSGGCGLVILQASKGHRIGQSCVKLVFEIKDIGEFRKSCPIKFGPTHKGNGYTFANARDPAKNLIQISTYSRDNCLKGQRPVICQPGS